MSKLASDLIHRFIKALSPAEKRYFKLFASRHTIGNKNEYLRMFESIDKMKNYDDVLLRKTFKQLKAANSFAIAKNRLYETILRSLDSFHSESSVDVQLRSFLHYAEILFKKSLYDECGKMLNKAKKIAVKYEKHSVLIDIYKWQKKLLEKDGYATINDDDLKHLLEEDLLTLEKINNYCEFWYIKSRLILMLNRYGKVRDLKELENFKTIIDNILMKSEDKALSYETRYLYYHIYSAYYFGLGDYHNSYNYILKHLQLIELNAELIQDEPNKYFAVLSNMIYLCSQLNKQKEIPSWLKKLRNISNVAGKKMTEDLAIKLFSTSMSAELSLYIQGGRFEEALKLIEPIDAGLKKFKGGMSKVREAYFYFTIAIVYFALGDFTLSLRWLNRLLNDSELDANQDIHSLARILDLVVHLEMGNKELIPYTLRSVLRYLDKRKRMFRFETIFLEFIKKIARSRTNADTMTSFIELQRELKIIAEDAYERQVFEQFDFLSWVESKIHNLSFADVVKQKLKNKKVLH